MYERLKLDKILENGFRKILLPFIATRLNSINKLNKQSNDKIQVY